MCGKRKARASRSNERFKRLEGCNLARVRERVAGVMGDGGIDTHTRIHGCTHTTERNRRDVVRVRWYISSNFQNSWKFMYLHRVLRIYPYVGYRFKKNERINVVRCIFAPVFFLHRPESTIALHSFLFLVFQILYTLLISRV